MGKNSNLNKAKANKNDEFYTQLIDIEKELRHYKLHFKDKTVLCNCDNPKFSNFVKYFLNNFENLGINRLICTSFSISADDPPTATIYYGPDNFIKIPLHNNGDFNSDECIEFLKKADIIVTNPPFSKAVEFFELLFKYNKDFLIVGNLNWLGYKNIFPRFKNNELWLGYNSLKSFITPDNQIKNFGNIYWFTNLHITKQEKEIVLTEVYTPEKYPKFDNYDAINVDKVKDIPKDYYGVMGVPLSFATKYCPTQFQIIGMDLNNLVEELNIGKMGAEWIRVYKQQGGTGNYTENMHNLCYIKDGKAYVKYKRILIKKVDKNYKIHPKFVA